jgi:MoaA/NifB/PqqE/SkfB family radical SAM enzyme
MTNFHWQKFPIKTATACQSKWAWSTVWLDSAKTASCFRVEKLNLTPDNFDNFHNLPEKINDRERMLQGLWPDNNRCNYCKSIENAGGYSDRMHYNSIGGYTPKELKKDKQATTVTPKIVEVYYTNECNLACIYCTDRCSSKIEAENDRYLGKDRPKLFHSPFKEELYQKFLIWLRENIKNLQRLNLLGGETFIQHKLLNDVITIINENPNPFLQLNIVSNFNAPKKYFYKYIDEIKKLYDSKKIGRFDLTCSVDCWGPQQEYVRSGLNLKLLEEYLSYAAQQDEKWLYLNINSTITCMTIKTMPKLIEKIKKYSGNRQIHHSFEILLGHEYQNPKIFDYSFWKKDLEDIIKLMKGNSFESIELAERMSGLQKMLQVNCKQDNEKIAKLHAYLDELDRRRGTDWRPLFPYLIV